VILVATSLLAFGLFAFGREAARIEGLPVPA
jgi:hypothetical protein